MVSLLQLDMGALVRLGEPVELAVEPAVAVADAAIGKS